MTLTEKEARAIAEKLVRESGRDLVITEFSDVEDADNSEDGLFFFWVEDEETGVSYYPGELFPAIRKSDGKLVDYFLPPPAF